MAKVNFIPQPAPPPPAPPTLASLLPWGAPSFVTSGQTLESNKAYFYDLNGGGPFGTVQMPQAPADGDEVQLTRFSAGATANSFTVSCAPGVDQFMQYDGSESIAIVYSDGIVNTRSQRFKYNAAIQRWVSIARNTN